VKSRLLLMLVTPFLLSCSSSDPQTVSSLSAPIPEPAPAATVTISANGFDLAEVQVTVGSRVTFANADMRMREIYSGLDHVRFECPEIDAVGLILPGQSRQTRVFESSRTCAFHDATNLGNQAFQGRVVVVR